MDVQTPIALKELSAWMYQHLEQALCVDPVHWDILRFPKNVMVIIRNCNVCHKQL